MIRYLLTMFTALALALPALATQHSTASLTEGEVRKVDTAARKITIKHGPILNLEMPAMTMAFPVKDPALLERVKPGDKVRFEAQRIDGVIIVTAIEKTNN